MLESKIANADFEPVWEDQSFAELQWKWDDMHCPQPLAPLASDYMTRTLSDGVSYYYRLTGQPVEWFGRSINGYVYFTTRLGVPETERARINSEIEKFDRQLSPGIRDYWDSQALPALHEIYDWLRSAPLETASFAELADLWDEACERATRAWEIHFIVVSGCYPCLDSFIDLYQSLVEGGQATDALSMTQGQPGDLHRVESDLYNLTQQVKRSPALLRLLAEHTDLSLQELTTVDGGPEFLEALRHFLSEHGHLGQPFDDLSYPSWEDQPELLMVELRKRLGEEREDPEQLRLRIADQADALAASIRERLRERPEELARLEEALALARAGGSLTEDHNYQLDRMIHAYFHRFAVQTGKRLAEVNVLEAPRDIFFLHMHEIADTLRKENKPDLNPLIAGRKSELDKQRSLRPPKIVGKVRPPSDSTNRFSPTPTEADEAGVLKGTGASAGKVTATARIVLSPADFERVLPGDILVCPASNPSWVPLYGIIAGLVTNTGGVLSHAAITAREFGVPAVVGAAKATQLIRDGQTIEIDGAAGIVRPI